MSYSTRFNGNRWRSEDNSVKTDAFANGEQQFIQLERSGNSFYFRRKANAGDAWWTFKTLTRADLDGLPLQVGIWQANYTSPAQSGTLDNFSITGPNVGLPPPTPGTLIYGK